MFLSCETIFYPTTMLGWNPERVVNSSLKLKIPIVDHYFSIHEHYVQVFSFFILFSIFKTKTLPNNLKYLGNTSNCFQLILTLEHIFEQKTKNHLKDINKRSRSINLFPSILLPKPLMPSSSTNKDTIIV